MEEYIIFKKCIEILSRTKKDAEYYFSGIFNGIYEDTKNI